MNFLKSNEEKFLNYQLNSSWVIISLILMTALFCQALNKEKFSTDHSLRESSTTLQFKYIVFTVVFFGMQ